MAEESEPPSGRFNSTTGKMASLKRWEGITEEQRSQFGAYLAHKRWNKLKKRVKRHHRKNGNDKSNKNGSGLNDAAAAASVIKALSHEMGNLRVPSFQLNIKKSC